MTSSPNDSAPRVDFLAQKAIIKVFSNLMRLRLATQEGHQKRMTLDILRSAFHDALSGHPSQVLEDGVMSAEGVLFRASFNKLQDQLLQEVGSGLTPEETAQFDR